MYTPHVPCQWMYLKLFSFFFSPFGVFLFGGFEVSCFLLPGQLPTLPLLFMHLLCLYLKIFIHVIHSMLKEYRRKYMCLSPYGSWSWTWITSKTKKSKKNLKKTFVCQLSLTKRLFYPMGHPSRKVATFQLPNCAMQLLSLPVHKNLEKHEMWKYFNSFQDYA